MTNLKDTESQVTLEDSRTLTGKKCGGWHGYQRRDEKIHRMTLSNTVVITGLHANIFSMTQPLQKGFQVTSEGEILIIKKNPTEIYFDEKMANKSGEGFLLTAKVCNIANDDALLVYEKRDSKWKASVNPECTAVRK